MTIEQLKWFLFEHKVPDSAEIKFMAGFCDVYSFSDDVEVESIDYLTKENILQIYGK